MLARDIPGRVRALGLATTGGMLPAGKPVPAAAVARKARLRQLWQGLSQDVTTQGSAPPSVSVWPLLSTTWDQGSPYNAVVRSHIGGSTDYPAGCTATALGQVIRYFGYPSSASGSNNVCVEGEPRSASFSATYNYADMPGSLAGATQTQIQPVAELLWDIGVADGMNYHMSNGVPSGGGPLLGVGATVLQNTFHYATAVTDYGGDATVMGNVRTSLDAGSPVPMHIQGSAGGHAIVCDGYGADSQSTRYYHLNMGWSGSGNGWYDFPDAAFLTNDGEWRWDTLLGVVRDIKPGGGAGPGLGPDPPGAYKVAGRVTDTNAWVDSADTKVIRLLAATPLDYNTEYTVIASGLFRQSGEALPNDGGWWSVPASPLHVASVSPADGAIDVDVYSSIAITFESVIRPDPEAPAPTPVTLEITPALEGSGSCSADGRTYAFAPGAGGGGTGATDQMGLRQTGPGDIDAPPALAYSTVYTVVVTGVTDASGKKLTAPVAAINCRSAAEAKMVRRSDSSWLPTCGNRRVRKVARRPPAAEPVGHRAPTA